MEKENRLQIFKEQQLIPISQNENGDVTVSGRELYKFLKVQQDFSDWMKKQLEMIGAIENKDFTLLKGNCSTMRPRATIEYVLTLDIAKEICMIAGVAPRTNEETKKLSKQARQYFITVEKAWNSPEMIMKRALEIAKRNIENLKFENIKKDKQLKEQRPKVLFAESVQASQTSILIGDLAKIIKQNGHDTGSKRLFEWMRNNGYLIKRRGTDYNMPTQKAVEAGLFEIKETSIIHSDGHISISKTSKVTGKGQIYFVNKFKEEDKKWKRN